MQGAQAVRKIEQAYLLRQLQGMPTLPWLWLAPAQDWRPDPALGTRGIRLHRESVAGQFGGDLRCGLPLPLAAESVNAIVLQHIAGAHADTLLRECIRVLMPGGRLWITMFNPCSPYRLHWQWYGAGSPSVWHCRGVVQRSGLRCAPVRYLGPLWSAGNSGLLPAPSLLRAVCVLEAHKRTSAMIGPTAIPLRLQRPLAT